jgi:hypothetical protein
MAFIGSITSHSKVHRYSGGLSCFTRRLKQALPYNAPAFSEDGARRFLKAFRDTLSFAKLEGESYTPGGEPENEPPVPLKNPEGGNINTLPREIQRALGSNLGPQKASSVAYTWPLPDGNDVEVAFKQAPTPKAVDRLIAYLGMMKEDLTVSFDEIRELDAHADWLRQQREEH